MGARRHFDLLSTVARRVGTAALVVGLISGDTCGQSVTEPVVWGQHVFVIPYKWSSGTNRAAVREVVLYLSKDQGANWKEVTRARPDVQSFMYRAPRDGDYGFCIRTVDASGRKWPSGPMTAELRVVVDTVLPTLAIRQATLNAGGQLTVEATASDPQLDASSITIAYQDPRTGRWTSMHATVSPSTGPTATARATANLPVGSGRVPVRVAAKDRAGNPASAGGMAVSPGGAVQSAQVVSSPVSAPLAQRNDGAPIDPFTSNSAFGQLAASSQPAATTGPWPSSGAQPAAPVRPSGQVWLPDNVSRPSVAMAPGEPGASASARMLQRSLAAQQPSSAFRFASNSPVTDLPRTGVAAPATRRLVVNSSRFELEYDLHSVGRWGVSKVEVWGTVDQGRTWQSYAIDADLRSPVDVETPGDGVFGFRIVVQSVGGLEQHPPRAGDQPDVYVEVDQSRPATSLLNAMQPEGYFADHLVITWQASDANLAERPISLLYAAKPSGPWQPIASNLENSGRYSWRLQRHLPSQLFVRVEARDRAGNLGVDQSTAAVGIRLPHSSGQIRGARPLE